MIGWFRSLFAKPSSPSRPVVSVQLLGGGRYSREEILGLMKDVEEALPAPEPKYSRAQALAMIEAINAAVADGARLRLNPDVPAP